MTPIQVSLERCHWDISIDLLFCGNTDFFFASRQNRVWKNGSRGCAISEGVLRYLKYALWPQGCVHSPKWQYCHPFRGGGLNKCVNERRRTARRTAHQNKSPWTQLSWHDALYVLSGDSKRVNSPPTPGCGTIKISVCNTAPASGLHPVKRRARYWTTRSIKLFFGETNMRPSRSTSPLLALQR